MKNFRKEILSFLLIVFLILNATSQNTEGSVTESDIKVEKRNKQKKKKKKFKLPEIDLSHWKVTVPVNNDNGKPLEVSPPEILNYATNEC